LYETSTVAGARYYGEPNWRSEVVNMLGAQYRSIRVPDVITMPWFGDEPPTAGASERVSDQQAYTLALSRYFAMFRQERGLLRQVFVTFRDRTPPADYVPAERQAVQLLERATGKGVGDLDQAFFAWYPSVANPQRRLHAGQIEQKEIPRELPPSVER